MADIQFVRKDSPFMGYDRVKVYYNKNGKDQNAKFMNYGTQHKPNFKIIEDNHYAKNSLKDDELNKFSTELNNNKWKLL